MENECNGAEDEYIPDSIDWSSTDDDSDDRSISTNSLEDIRGGNYVYPYINTRDDILKTRDRIGQAQSEWKGEELKILAKRVVKGLH